MHAVHAYMYILVLCTYMAPCKSSSLTDQLLVAVVVAQVLFETYICYRLVYNFGCLFNSHSLRCFFFVYMLPLLAQHHHRFAQMVKMMVTVVIVFTMCWLPFNVLLIVSI